VAHPSTIQIGLTHGVFVVEKEAMAARKSHVNVPCRRYLHKPNLELMQSTGAIGGDGTVQHVLFVLFVVLSADEAGRGCVCVWVATLPKKKGLCGFDVFL
jgi:hypothetical protein